MTLMTPEALEKQILETRNSLSTDRLDMSFGEIMSMYERKEIIITIGIAMNINYYEKSGNEFISEKIQGLKGDKNHYYIKTIREK